MKMKKILAVGCAASCAAAMMATPVFAVSEEGWTKSGDTAAWITVSSTSDGSPSPDGGGGSSALVGLDFSVTAQIHFNGSKEGVLTQVEDYQMKNHNDVGSIECTKITAEAAGGWSLVNDDAETIKALPVGTTSVGFTIAGTSLHNNAEATVNATALPKGAPVTITTVSGHCAPQKEEVKAKVATFTATIGLVEAVK